MPRGAERELQAGLSEFARYRREHITGDEKGEAQVFLDRFFRALGYEGVREAGGTLEMRVRRRDNRGTAFADLVLKPRVLIEMKRSGEDLRRHYRQAFEYWIDLVPDRPKYVLLCNFDDFWIYDLNRQLDEPVDRISIDDLPRRWEAFGFLLPQEERPLFENDLVEVTRESAAAVAALFNALMGRGVLRSHAQRFTLQCVMAMFAEDIGLLPRHYFGEAVRDSLAGGSAYDLVFGLFAEMNRPGETAGGRFAGTPYFNGGLFRDITPFEVAPAELELLHQASLYDWAAVRPAIFGTIFEQSMGAGERHAFGAHFTSEADIQKIVLPTIVRPWREAIDAATTLSELGSIEQALLSYRVLDPACGCGNFLYIAYRELRRLERQLSEKRGERRRRATQTAASFLSPRQFFGIDINSFAVEVAKVTLMLARKLSADELGDEERVLPLDDLDSNFRAADALAIDWPEFDVCIGNPPYLGRRRIVEERGADYAAWLAQEFPEIGGVSDYVVYWYRKTHDLLPTGSRAGLVGTKTIRQTDSRKASLDYIVDHDGVIFDAVASQPWSGDASVEVAIVNWIKGPYSGRRTLWLSGGDSKLELDTIPGSLSPNADLRSAQVIKANRKPKRCFQGQTPGHTPGFVLSLEEAGQLIADDPGAEAILFPFLTGDELNGQGRPTRFLIDFDCDDAMTARSTSPGAYERVRAVVLPDRKASARREAQQNDSIRTRSPNSRLNRHHAGFLDRWWQLSYRRAELIAAIEPLDRYIALSRVAVVTRQSIYAFVSKRVRPADSLQVFAFEDDYSFGVLHSTLHRTWFEERCSTLRQDLRYTASTVFDTFPWPQAPTDGQVGAVVDAAAALLEFRDERAGRGIPLGRQYDSLREPGRNPLRDLHAALDDAVLEAYGFDRNEDALVQLLALNASIIEAERRRDAVAAVRGPGSEDLSETKRTSFAIQP